MVVVGVDIDDVDERGREQVTSGRGTSPYIYLTCKYRFDLVVSQDLSLIDRNLKLVPEQCLSVCLPREWESIQIVLN